MHLFEFMDLPLLPEGLRHTLRDILECCNSLPFRPYNKCIAAKAAELAAAHGIKRVVELGAGSAPLTTELLASGLSTEVILTPCDINPDRVAYEGLQARNPGRVQPIFAPVDFSKEQSWEAGTLLVLSGTFHHISAAQRVKVLQRMISDAGWVVVAEPLRRTPGSAFFVLLSLVPALLLPLMECRRKGVMRRLLWCWVVPAAPLLFIWDGLVSVLRIWSPEAWQETASQLAGRVSVEESGFCQIVTLRRRKE